MHVRDFIAKWKANARSERAACQEHFSDLCGVLGEPTPNTDPTGAAYAFEKGATKASGGDRWADVWRHGCFAWEYKGKNKNLDGVHRQQSRLSGTHRQQRRSGSITFSDFPRKALAYCAERTE